MSNGDRGYVGRYADYLMTASGGVRPRVINLAISGETSSSFFGPIGTGIDGATAPGRNTNYLGDNANLNQNQLMLKTIDGIGAGNTIDHVTLTLGANDLFYAVATGADFGQTLATWLANETALLTSLRSKLPTADLILLNYYNPYLPYQNKPNSPLFGLSQASGYALPILNSVIAKLATQFGAGYADVYSQFPASTVLDETYVDQPKANVHPTNAGYDRITAAVEAVPEPASLILVGLGLGGMAALARRRVRGSLVAA